MTTASERAYRIIRAEIISGALAPGTPLREEQLADICGVSRTPVREALRRLETENFLRQTAGRRSFVADWSLDSVRDAFDLRALLESHAAQRAAERIDRDGMEALRAANRLLGEAIARESPDISSFLEQNRAFHAVIIDAADSEPLRRALAGVVEQPVVLRTARTYDRGELAQSMRDHDELIAAFERRDAAWAAAVMTAHIRRAAYVYSIAFDRARQSQAA